MTSTQSPTNDRLPTEERVLDAALTMIAGPLRFRSPDGPLWALVAGRGAIGARAMVFSLVGKDRRSLGAGVRVRRVHVEFCLIPSAFELAEWGWPDSGLGRRAVKMEDNPGRLGLGGANLGEWVPDEVRASIAFLRWGFGHEWALHLERCACRQGVSFQLGLKGREVREALFLAQEADEFDLEALAVEVARVVEQVDFDAQFGICLLYTSPSPRDS